MSRTKSKLPSKTATINASVTEEFKAKWQARAFKKRKTPATMAREALEAHYSANP